MRSPAIDREAFCDVVRGFTGTPFVHRGRLPGVGLDCAGVVVCGLRAFGVNAPNILYGPNPTEAELFDGLAAVASPKPVEDRLPSDVLTFAVGGRQVHIGVYTGRLENGIECIVVPDRRRRIQTHALQLERVVSCWHIKGVG